MRTHNASFMLIIYWKRTAPTSKPAPRNIISTTTAQLAELASKAKPRLLILYHASISWRPTVDSVRSTPSALLYEMTSRYSGHVVVGRDLDVY